MFSFSLMKLIRCFNSYFVHLFHPNCHIWGWKNMYPGKIVPKLFTSFIYLCGRLVLVITFRSRQFDKSNFGLIISWSPWVVCACLLIITEGRWEVHLMGVLEDFLVSLLGDVDIFEISFSKLSLSNKRFFLDVSSFYSLFIIFSP